MGQARGKRPQQRNGELVMDSYAIPIIWWLGWFAIASVAYAILFIWFWRGGRQTSAGESRQGETASREDAKS